MTRDELMLFMLHWLAKHDDDELYTVDDNDGCVYIQLQEY